MAHMQAQKDRRYVVAFVVNDIALTRLNTIVSTYSETPSYRVSLSDGTVLQPSTFQELLELPNSSNRDIRKIDVDTPYSAKLRIELSVDADRFSDTVVFTTRGEERDVVFVSGKLDEWVDSVSQWYGFYSVSSGSVMVIQGVLWALGLSLTIFSFLQTISHKTVIWTGIL